MSNQAPQLASASDFDFYHSETDTVSLPKTDTVPAQQHQDHEDVSTTIGRGQRPRQLGRYQESIELEKLDEYGQIESSISAAPSKPRKSRKAKKKRIDHTLTDEDDNDFSGSSSESESAGSGDGNISNDEVISLLPAKSAPAPSKASAKRKRSQRHLQKGARAVNQLSTSTSLASLASTSAASLTEDPSVTPAPTAGAATSKTKNAIYYFYNTVQLNDKGQPGEEGDRHFKCVHGNHTVITIHKTGRHNLHKLVTNLKSASPSMYSLYQAINGRQAMQDEINLASGKTVFDPSKHNILIKNSQAAQANIRGAFEKQVNAAAGPWDQQKFERLLTEWVVMTDQPFDTVDHSDFRNLLSYAHHPAPGMHIPHCDALKRRVMKMGSEGVKEIKQMFADLPGKISISLDAWTSSNNYAFLAIVAHYVTNDGYLEELLIDFRELVGEHSGENMAEAVWEVLLHYNIQNRIMAFMMDNASNNDTFVDGIVNRAANVGIFLDATWIRLRCLPHTIHLAAIKLLEGLGIVTASNAKKARSRAGNYQQSATTLVETDDSDDIAAAFADNDSEDPLDLAPSTGDNILPGVDKLRKIIRAVRSSPQRKQAWLSQVKTSIQAENISNNPRQALMLILDVKTRWSSTHQMLARAVLFRDEVHSFVLHSKDLRALELSDEEWDAVEQVTKWLLNFREATTQMSTTKKPMLSTTHAIFRGLEDEIKKIFAGLPSSAPRQLKAGLLNAYQKLSEYYYKYDESPFYTWAALLDPRISYEGVRCDYESDPDLLNYLGTAKQQLHEHYSQHYAGRNNVPSASSTTINPAAPSSGNHSTTEKVNFVARYRKDKVSINELEEYFKLPPEDFETCDPLKWWAGRQAQFPNVYRLACDVLSIPGSAVAVERIFSGGRDTISLRRASLQPSTIRALMLLKQQLRLKRASPTQL